MKTAGNLLIAAMMMVCVLAHAAAPASVRLDIPAQRLQDALNALAGQAGLQLVFEVPAVKGKTSPKLEGSYTPEAALKRMLAGTTLRYEFIGENIVAIRAQAEGSTTTGVEKSAGPVTQLARVDGQAGDPGAKTEPSPSSAASDAAPTDVVVTGSRIRGVLGEASAQPVFTYTRQDLDRFGAQTFAELRRYIPQLPQTDWNTQMETSPRGSPGGGSGSLGFNDFGEGLRNLGGSATLVLVDGRRVPKLGQSYATTTAYDLSGIPLSAVERIEVLTDGASALYGADALAGVVNIILRKNYRGTQLSSHYTNSFDSDTAEREIQLAHGLRTERLSLTLSANLTRTNSLAPRDRWWTATSDKRPWGGSDGRLNVPGGAGGVRSADGGNLPGLDSPVAGIPVNSTGGNLTVADFANAPLTDRIDSAQYTNYGSRETQGLRLSGSYALAPWFEVFADGAWNRNATLGPTPGLVTARYDTWPASFSSRVELPATYAGNPFGVPIYLERVLWEFMDVSTNDYEIDTYSGLAGLRGRLPADWRYEVGISKRWSAYGVTGYGISTGGTGNIYPLLSASINSPEPSERIQLLYDARSHQAHDADFYHDFMLVNDFSEQPDVWLYDVKFDGPLWDLPAGAVQVAVGGEFQRDSVDLGSWNTQQRMGGRFGRESLASFLEVQVPLLSAAQGLPLAHRLSANLSLRSDDYNDFGGKTVPRYSLFYQPVHWLALRGSYGEGYKVPTLHQLHRILSTIGRSSSTAANPLIDPERNGTPWIGSYGVTSGGNPDLLPEQSESVSAGMVLDVPAIPGLSFSVDYYDLKNTDRVAVLARQDYLDYFPERIQRADPTPEETAAGMSGVMLRMDTRPVNLAYLRTQGFDFEARYNRALGDGSTLYLRTTVTRPRFTESRTTPTAALVDTSARTPWRGTGYAFWNRGPLELGAIATYTHRYLTASSVPIDPVTLWDMQASYDFTRSGWRPEGWRGRVFSGAHVSFKLMNVFDKEPQIRLGSSLGNVDPRGRRYQLALQLTF